MKKKLKICPIVTPFNDNQIDLQKMENIASSLFSSGIDKLFLCGTTGLGPTLSFQEKMTVIKGMEQFKDRSIVQVGSLNLSESIELAKEASRMEYYAIASLPPYYYFNVPDEWIVRHLLEISKIHPLYAYNIPATTNNRIEPAMLKEVNKRGGNVIGIKESLQDIGHMINFKIEMGEDFTVLNGPDNLIVPALRSGMDGSIGAGSNFLTDIFVSLVDNYLDDSSFIVQQKMNKVMSVINSYGRWAAIYSAIKLLRKIDAGEPRAPVFPLTNTQEEELEKKIRSILGDEKL